MNTLDGTSTLLAILDQWKGKKLDRAILRDEFKGTDPFADFVHNRITWTEDQVHKMRNDPSHLGTDRITDYVNGTLSATDRAEVKKHMDACLFCSYQEFQMHLKLKPWHPDRQAISDLVCAGSPEILGDILGYQWTEIDVSDLQVAQLTVLHFWQEHGVVANVNAEPCQQTEEDMINSLIGLEGTADHLADDCPDCQAIFDEIMALRQ